jgi:hypothetical protein
VGLPISSSRSESAINVLGNARMNKFWQMLWSPARRGSKAASDCAASPSQMGRFETPWLAAANPSALADLSGQWIDRVHDCRPPTGIFLDMDSSVSPTHG